MTGRYWDDRETIERRIYRALVVQHSESNDLDAVEYLARQSGWD